MNSQILIPIPSRDFDPTECAVPWKILRSHGFDVHFATPSGEMAECDSRMLSGHGLGPLAFALRADRNARSAYSELVKSPEFRAPVSWPEIDLNAYAGLVLPGGHAPGMREYLESPLLQSLVAKAFDREMPIGAICHGVVLAARSGKLRERRTTALLKSQETLAWRLTRLWLGDYYRTYPQTVEDEVRATGCVFESGPPALLRDSPTHLSRGFVVRDRNYVSARWPGDAHRFANEFVQCLLSGLSR